MLCCQLALTSTCSGTDSNIASLNTQEKADTRAQLKRNKYHEKLGWVDGLKLRGFTPYYSTARGAAFNVNSMDVLKALPSASVDLVFTSPPFALTRKKEYGNEPLDRYLGWFMPFCLEIKRVLKPTGSFVLDIGGAWVPGAPVRSIYHFDLAVRLSREFKL